MNSFQFEIVFLSSAIDTSTNGCGGCVMMAIMGRLRALVVEVLKSGKWSTQLSFKLSQKGVVTYCV